MAKFSSRLALVAAAPVLVLVACSSDTSNGDDDPGLASSSSSGEATSSSSGAPSSSSSSGQASSSSGSNSSSSSSSGEVPVSCTNGVKDGNEADVDCGLACPARCVTGKTCNGPVDCAEHVCSEGVCAAPSEDDGVKNGAETDIDCGGPDARKCSFPKRCVLATDCLSEICDAEGKCGATHEDGVKNLGETDIDCGGPATLRCAPGRACSTFNDCAGGSNCVGQVCREATFNDNFKNLGETDVDCGGPAPVGCGNLQSCVLQTDCKGVLFCNTSRAQPRCESPVGNDGITNGTETDIDCGGELTRQSCAIGRGCSVGTDCDTRVCGAGPTDPAASPKPGLAKRCLAPTNSDGVKNGAETDVDCGGPGNVKLCSVGKVCSASADCASDGCHSTKKICVLRRSCARTYGGDTCGPTENGGDDCCATIDVQRPTKPKVALAKYKTTAGRMREFITRVNGDVKGYIAGLNLPANRWNTAAWSPWLPSNMDEVALRFGPNASPDEAYFGTITGARGCQVSVGGGRAYWFSQGDGVGAGAVPDNELGKYSHDILDQKVMSCLMPSVAAAFCIWDGGELADPDDIKMAWNDSATVAGVVTNTREYPWGNFPLPPTNRGGTTAECTNSNCNAYIVHQWNYLYPDYKAPDSTAIIPAPGRRPLGAGPKGHMDLAGAGFEYAKRTPASGNGSLHTFNNGSFEGHVPTKFGGFGNAELSRRYYAFTAGRCAYPAAP